MANACIQYDRYQLVMNIGRQLCAEQEPICKLPAVPSLLPTYLFCAGEVRNLKF